MADSDELFWRETYFILFPRKRRPTLKQVSMALANANKHFQLENPSADSAGLIESLLIESPQDHAAVEVSYEMGAGVIEQNLAWAKEFKKQLPPAKLQKLIKADARLDVAHFERMPAASATYESDEYGDDFDDEAAMEMLDPTCLLTVVETLADLTGGLTFDPAAGEILS